jgi:putative heme-binding domain-containing protein
MKNRHVGRVAAVVMASWACPSHGHAQDSAGFERHAMEHAGDAKRGRDIFNAAGSLCATCHSVDGSASKVGPDLKTIGHKFERRDLIRSVLEPGATIAVGYATTSVALKDGGSRVGVVKSVTPEAIELTGIDGTVTRIATADIASRKSGSFSLMPAGLHATMGLAEFADLIAYLGSLRASADGGRPGSPERISPSRVQARLEPLFDLTFDHPTLFGRVPGTGDRAGLVLEHAGRIRAVEGIGGKATDRAFLDLSHKVKPGGATGLLGLAFHPGFEQNRRYLLQYQVQEEGITFTIIEERTMKPDRVEDSGAPGREVIRIRAATLDHCGGSIGFGKDGFLHFGMGDTGPHRDPQGRGQDMGHLLGKMLRIDVDRRDAGLGYAVPADNPFVGVAGVRPEIWASGFRNPYRFSWDRATGEMWVADVGQDQFDEVAIVRRGENHGWNVYEGHHPFSGEFRRADEVYVEPVISYSRRHGVSVTGGHVYRGTKAPRLAGWYVFGDFESRRIWALRQQGGKLGEVVEIARAPSRITDFSLDREGEFAVTGFDDGRIYRLVLDEVDPRAVGEAEARER